MKSENSSCKLDWRFIFLAVILVLFTQTAEVIAAAPGNPETLSVPRSDTADILFGSMTLLTPNGGEVLASGFPYTISWTAPSSAVKFKLKYSVDNGRTPMGSDLTIDFYFQLDY
jgi:hypothetical protein